MKKTPIFLILLSFTFILTSCKSFKETSKSNVETNNIIEVQHIRNASIIISFNDLKILVDPVLSDKGDEPPMPFSNTNKNPLIELPAEKSELLKDISAVLLTHYHIDHFDIGTEKKLSKTMLIFCQPYDYDKLKEKGFLNVQAVDSTFNYKGITISRFSASHHEGATGAPPFGESSSFYLETKEESIFITGDAILDERLSNSLTKTNPKVIVANTGECQFTEENPVLAPNTTMTLTRDELKQITELLPNSKLIAIHMDAINHCSLTKNDLKEYIETEQLKEHIVIPNEGDVISYKQAIYD